MNRQKNDRSNYGGGKYKAIKIDDQVADKDFKLWTLDNLPLDGYFVTDIDAAFRNVQGDLLLMEKKCFNAKPSETQYITMQMIHKLCVAGAKALNNRVTVKLSNGRTISIPVYFHGVHLLQLSGDTFGNSTLMLDNRPISEQRLIEYLSFCDVVQQKKTA